LHDVLEIGFLVETNQRIQIDSGTFGLANAAVSWGLSFAM
jgi:hypothetical protein